MDRKAVEALPEVNQFTALTKALNAEVNPSRVFGPRAGAKAVYLRLSKILHPDKTEADDVAEEGFQALTNLWSKAQAAILAGTYGEEDTPIIGTVTGRSRAFDLGPVLREGSIVTYHVAKRTMAGTYLAQVAKDPSLNDLMDNEARVLEKLRYPDGYWRDEGSRYVPRLVAHVQIDHAIDDGRHGRLLDAGAHHSVHAIGQLLAGEHGRPEKQTVGGSVSADLPRKPWPMRARVRDRHATARHELEKHQTVSRLFADLMQIAALERGIRGLVEPATEPGDEKRFEPEAGFEQVCKFEMRESLAIDDRQVLECRHARERERFGRQPPGVARDALPIELAEGIVVRQAFVVEQLNQRGRHRPELREFRGVPRI